jgi:hypothetical protein
MRTAARGIVGLGLTGLAACATLPPVVPEAAECRANFLGLDEKVAAAGVGDAGARRIEGFPYLRSTRFLASFRDAAEGEAFDAWVERLRQRDLESRKAELRNLGWTQPLDELAHLDRCGRQWAALDLADPRRRALLRERAVVPDDYSAWKRALGLYPLAVPFLKAGIDSFNDEVRADYATRVERLESPGRLVLWRAAVEHGPVADPSAWFEGRDALGIPRLDDARREQLARAHLPAWLIETAGPYDRPGAVTLAGGAPGADPHLPVTYVHHGYTRFRGAVLAQISYVVWFTERPAQGWLDPYSGTLDGVVWRVTLDTDGTPLLYDTIHACGCYHYYFPAKDLGAPAQGGFWSEPVLFPQGRAPRPPFAIRIATGTHYVRRLVPLTRVVAAEERRYSVSAYSKLLSLDDGSGGTRSLFGSGGLVEGTERGERWWLWPAGVRSPGAMRQLGRHATSFVGRSHFDDPFMLDRLFPTTLP